MARGWESKSVEDQVAEAEAAKEARAKPHLSETQREERERRESLRLRRALILQRLERATNQRYRAQLQEQLKEVDGLMAALDLEKRLAE